MKRATVFVIALIFSALLSRGAAAAMPPPVTVDIPLPPQPNAVLANPDNGNLRGFLYRPEQPRTGNPALVLLHDCFGLLDYQRTWAQMLAEWGYVVLLVDSFGPRGLGATCDSGTGINSGTGLAADAEAARNYLAVLPSADEERTGLPAVDPDRIALIAWGAGAIRSLATPFTAAVAFYPDCRQLPEQPVDTPLLILAGAEDDWAPPQWCTPMVKKNVAAGLEHRIWIYPDAFYGFDNPTNRTRTFLKSIYNSRGQGSYGANVGYNARAHEDSVTRVERFLNPHLRLTLAATYPSKSYSPLPRQLDTDETPAVMYGLGNWVIEPSEPGPDMPPAGRSVFDQLFATNDGSGHNIPFPFVTMIDRLGENLKPPRPGRDPVVQVLIPLGRSLQRNAAAPNFFTYPRLVTAIVGEPLPEPGSKPLLLRDRLFMGYLEKINVLEVISYNEAASRFEFQVVKDYGPGLTPKVFYADRALCTSCHQNGAPLFSREDWQETNSNNMEIGKKLGGPGKIYHGVPMVGRGQMAAAIDLATDRANLFSVLQKLWREGCGPGNGERAIRCRAAAFLAMLQFRLSDDIDFDRSRRDFGESYLTTVRDNWRQRWPAGLFVPNPDIPNRNPLADGNDITGSRDPLTKRTPQEVWSGYRRSDLERMIIGLSESILATDIAKLNKILSAGPAASEHEFTSTCRLARRPQRGLAYPITFACDGDAEGNDFDVIGEFDDKAHAGQLKDLDIIGTRPIDLLNLDRTGQSGTATKFLFNVTRDGLSARLPNLHRVVSVTISSDRPATEGTRESPLIARVVLRTADESQALRQAIDSLAAKTKRGESALFADAPFHGPKAVAQVFAELGAPVTAWCCDADAPGPAIKFDTLVKSETTGGGAEHPPLRVMKTVCGVCHETPSRFPPNFLTGSRRQVYAKVGACASQILHRLQLWDVPPERRPHSAMPPTAHLQAMGMVPQIWRESDQLSTIRAFVETLAPANAELPDYSAKTAGTAWQLPPPCDLSAFADIN